VTTTEALQVAPALDRPATAIEIRAHVNLIQEVMKAVMIENVHYGTIPGTPKPTLYKPGSEKILSTFRIAIEPIVTDLSDGDQARFRVETRATAQASGAYLGSGVGEASSLEEKYKWRGMICQEEFDETPVDRRRAVWKKKDGKTFKVQQVRTQPADVANTILKMAKKRSQIDVTLTVTAASDVFAQDIEDLPDELREAVAGEDAPAKPAIQPPQRKSEAAPAGDVISEGQAKRFYAISKQHGHDDGGKAWLRQHYQIESDREIPKARYDAIVKAVQESRQPGGEG
jgi:hypothetical protein